jgi:hypothetical protein
MAALDLVLDVEVKVIARPRNALGTPVLSDQWVTTVKKQYIGYFDKLDIAPRALEAANVMGYLFDSTTQVKAVPAVQAPSSLLATSATLNGTVQDNNQSVVVSFLWGVNFGDPEEEDAAAQSPVSGDATTPVTFAATLVASTTYFCRVKTVAGGVTVISDPVTFTTPAP